MVTIKYGADGRQRWLTRYNDTNNNYTGLGPASGAAIALDKGGSVFVTGNANNVSNLTKAGTALTFSSATLVANDTDPLGRPLQVASIDQPSVGTIARNADGTFTYAPPAGFVGQVTLTYLVQGAKPGLAARATGHYYEFVAAPGICWTAAQTAPTKRPYQGMQG